MSVMNKLLVPDIGPFHEVEVLRIWVKEEYLIGPAQTILTLEVDNAEIDIPSLVSGLVRSIKVRIGDKVSKGSLILLFERRAYQLHPALEVLERGDAADQATLGTYYLFGHGVPKDEKKAVQLFRLAAQRDDADAQLFLGVAYARGLGVPTDAKEAARWVRLAAEQGHAAAQYDFAGMHAVGAGVPRDMKEALRWFRLAADQGDAQAQVMVGNAYSFGHGVPKDEKEAMRWCQLAAEQGHAEAQLAVGWAYFSGEGLPVDYEKAFHWSRLAADARLPEACNNLGWQYEQGMGVARDFGEAARWYRVAADQGHKEASERLANLRRRLPAATTETSATALPGNLGHRDNSITRFLEHAFDGFVGLGSVRGEVFRQATYAQIQKLRVEKGLSVPSSPSRHMVFLGNPGTGKTTIARIIAGLYHRLGILKSDNVIETDRAGLVAPYVGQTALKTREVVESALGGVLFIDEAYTLARGGDSDFGREAIDTLLKMMEDHRGELVVIVAGYESEMDSFINLNPGLASRFNRYIRFPNYSADELVTIFDKLRREHAYVTNEPIGFGLRQIFSREMQAQRQRFSNARYVRNLFERVIEAQAHRLITSGETSRSDLQTIARSDVESALGEVLPSEKRPSEDYKMALQRLDNLVGLGGVKVQVRRLVDFARTQRARSEAGIKVAAGFSQHLVFTGNPGTGKTTVARIIADLYFALGILPSNRIVEVDRSGLVAGYVGQSAIKTREVIERALGGVLFIDEAYALSSKNASEQDFGHEVIDTLLKAMEDHRDQMVVIVAGYHDEMSRFIESNPGLRSRFNRYIEFDNYNPENLFEIFTSLCHGAEYELDANAHAFLSKYLEKLFHVGKTTDNGRFVRNLFERCVEVQSQRVSRSGSMELSELKALSLGDVTIALKEFLGSFDLTSI